MKKKKILQAVTFIIFTLIYFSASMVLMGTPYRPLSEEVIYLRYALLLVGFVLLVVIYLFKGGLTLFRFPSYKSLFLFFIWILYSLSIVLSELGQQIVPIQGLLFLLIVPFLYFTVMPYITKISNHVIYQSLFTANVLYLLISFATKPFETIPYSGLAANPNGFGQMGALTYISGIFLLMSLSKKRILLKLFVMVSMALAFIGIILSTSRTSLVIVLFISIIVTLYLAVKKQKVKPILGFLVLGVIIWFSPIKDMYLVGIIEKFSQLNSSGNLLNGRTDIWETTFKDATLFGYGEHYFERFIEGAHNSMIYTLGAYGFASAILLSIFLLALNLLAFLHIFESKDKLAIFPFVLIATFTLFNITETMFGFIGNGITIAFYHVTGILMFHKWVDSAPETTN
jgi:O-antigen ligase